MKAIIFASDFEKFKEVFEKIIKEDYDEIIIVNELSNDYDYFSTILLKHIKITKVAPEINVGDDLFRC